MKLSVENYVPRERVGDLEGLKMIKDAGFDCVDYSFYWAKEDFPMYTDQYRAYAQRVRAYLDSIGLRCNQAHTGSRGKHPSSPAQQEAEEAAASQQASGTERRRSWCMPHKLRHTRRCGNPLREISLQRSIHRWTSLLPEHDPR